MPRAVVLVGGRGSRLGSATAETPKPLLPIEGQPFLYWLTLWLLSQGVRDIAFASGYLGSQVSAWIGTLRLPRGAHLSCRCEASALGTGGALLNCVDSGDETILVLNGDSLFLCDLPSMIVGFLESRGDGAIAASWADDASRFGSIDMDESGMMSSFGEKRAGSAWVNGGIYLFSESFLKQFPVGRPLSIEYDMIPQALASGAHIRVHASAAPFIDIGTRATFEAATAFVRSHSDQFPAGVLEAMSSAAPRRVDPL